VTSSASASPPVRPSAAPVESDDSSLATSPAKNTTSASKPSVEAARVRVGERTASILPCRADDATRRPAQPSVLRAGRRDPPAEVVELVQDRGGAPELVAARSVSGRRTPASCRRAIAANTLLRGAPVSPSTSSDETIGTAGRASRSAAAALPRRTGPTASRHSPGIAARRTALRRDSAAAMRAAAANDDSSGRTSPRR
jgi:hypothetical protein